MAKKRDSKVKWDLRTVVANAAFTKVGLMRMHKSYNNSRVHDGKRPVKLATVERYCNPGVRYENGPPAHFRSFLENYAAVLIV